jgi:hypothetical protein
MNFVYVLLILLILLGGGVWYGYQAGYYDLPRFAGGILAVIAVLLIFFAIAAPR